MNKVKVVKPAPRGSITADMTLHGTLAQGTSGEVYISSGDDWIRLSDGSGWGKTIEAQVLPVGSVITLEVGNA